MNMHRGLLLLYRATLRVCDIFQMYDVQLKSLTNVFSIVTVLTYFVTYQLWLWVNSAVRMSLDCGDTIIGPITFRIG